MSKYLAALQLVAPECMMQQISLSHLPLRRASRPSMSRSSVPSTKESHYWTTPPPSQPSAFTYPEQSDGPFGLDSLKAKPSFAIAVSGGGLRAAVNTFGWVRGFHMLQVRLDQASVLDPTNGSHPWTIQVRLTP